MLVDLACIVEGDGDVEAVPVAIRRIVQEIQPGLALRIHHPIRVPKNKLVKPGELERSVELGARRAGRGGAIFIVLDSDDDCPAALGPELLARARKIRSDLPISVVLAKREFEAWFLASARSLRGLRGLATNLEPPPDPESIRGAKEWLTARMTSDRSYTETLDQAALTASLDLQQARTAPSFDKFFRDIVAAIGGLASMG
ncbi:MAG TPA: DUF4276 family protein [Thermoanaerobaculia bacterium]|jgi:hypothetical protein|nr:DUF4276 family protein [Thermoanaerobaculia bacterium]